MAQSDGEIAIRLRAVLSEFSTPLRDAANQIKAFATNAAESLDKIEERSENLSHVWKDMFEAFIGIEAIEQLKKIAEAANAASDSLEIAARVTKNFGHAFDANQMEKFLQQLAASAEGGGFAINELRDSIQQLSNTGATEAQQERLLVDAIGLAAAKHISLAEATHVAVEAATGHVEMLGRYGIQVKDAEGKTLSFAAVMQNWETDVAGAAEARAEGLEGAFGRLGTAMNNVATGPGGQMLASIFIGAANAAANLFNTIAKMPAPLQDFIAATAATVVGLTALGLLLPGVKLAFEFFAGGVMLARDMLLGFGVVQAVIAGLRDLVTWVSLARDAFAGLAIAEWLAEAPILAIIGVITALIALVVEAIRKFQDLASVWKMITGLFKGPDTKGPAIPKTDWSGLGGSQDKDGQKGIDEYIEAHKAAIMAAVAAATQAVDEAQAKLAAVSAKLEELRDKRDPTKPLTKGNVAEEQSLITQELERERAVRDAIAEQRRAELTAAQQLNALAANLPAKDAEAAKHARDLREEAEKHVTAAIKLGAEYDKLGGTIAKLGRDFTAAGRALVEQSTELAKIAAEALKQSKALGAEELQNHLKAVFDRSQIAPANGQQQKDQRDVNSAQFAYSSAERDLGLANLALQAAEAARNIAGLGLDAKAAAQARADADIAVQKAELNLQKATDDAATALARLRYDQSVQRADRNPMIAILQKIASEIPGLSVGATGGIAFNPIQFLVQAFEQSKGFADIMKIVNELMQTFVQIFNSLRPVIDVLLKAVAAVADVFIDLYNFIARLLGLLGIHIQLLQQINTSFANLIPLVQIVHDIPTLNELAAGKLNSPLSLDPTTTSPITSAMNSPSLGGGILGGVLQVVAGISLVIEAIKLLGGGQMLGNLLGAGNGGIGGFISNLFGLSSSAAGAGGAAVEALPGADAAASAMATTSAATLTLGDAMSTTAATVSASSETLGAAMSGVSGTATTAVSGVTTAFGSLSSAVLAAGPLLLAGAAGALGGNLVGRLIGGTGSSNEKNGEFAGAGGAILGMILGGPFGALLGGLGGSLLGGLIGNRETTADQPDIYNAKTWGQDLANIQGSGYNGMVNMTANGQQFKENASLNSQLGGLGEGAFIANAIKEGMGSILTAQEKQEFTGYTGITGGKNGQLDLNNGIQVNWQTFVQNAQDAISKLTGQVSAGFMQIGGNLSAYLQSIAAQAQSVTSAIARSTNELAGTLSLGTPAYAMAGASNSNSTMNVTMPIAIAASVSSTTDVESLASTLGNRAVLAMRSIGIQSNRISR